MLSPIQRFIKLVALERREISAIYFYSILSGLISLSLPLGIQSIINLLFSGTISTSLVVLIIMVMVGVLCNGWLQITQMRVNEDIQRRIFTRFSLQFANKIPKLDLLSVDDYYLPELVNRFFDTAALQKGMTKVLLDFPTATVQIIFGIMLLSFYNSAFLIFGVALIALIALILRITYPLGIKTSVEESDYKYEVGNWLEDVARTIKTIKFMGADTLSVNKADELVGGYLDAREKHFKVLQVQYWSFVFFKVIITGALLIVGTLLVLQQQLNLGQFISAEIVIIMLINNIEKLIGSLDVVYDMLTSLEKVSKVLDKPSERENGILPQGNGGVAIKADKLSYRFNSDDYIFKNLNIEIAAGEKVCIFGTEGSGKSTLLRLLTGAYEDYKGQILIDGYPFRDYNLLAFRKKVGVYLATPDLFAGTLLDNITLGQQIPIDEVLRISEQVGLLPFIQSLPQGLDTAIDSVGKRLPRNTMNKIMITRSLINKPRLLLMEDCWSGLEINEQVKLSNFLTSAENSYTMVAVTNNDLFARSCNRIILLDNGEVVEQGTFEQVEKSQAYRKLFRQFSN